MYIYVARARARATHGALSPPAPIKREKKSARRAKRNPFYFLSQPLSAAYNWKIKPQPGTNKKFTRSHDALYIKLYLSQHMNIWLKKSPLTIG